ncbi:MAG: maleylpyruvate isomerase family mycothiol-dependent enzyme [Actinomycetota bacterium]
MGSQTVDSVQGLRAKGAIYEDLRHQMLGLVADLDDPGAVPVPACPGWSIHDLISHLSGACADVLAGNIAELASDEWTDAQVRARRELPFSEVVAEWNELGPQIAAMVDDFPGRYPDNAIADLVSHEHDIRHALGRPGRRDSEAVEIALDFVVTMIIHPGMRSLGLGPLAVKTADQRWVVGTPDAVPSMFDLDAMRQGVLAGAFDNSDEIPVGTVSAPSFELLRAFTGRRSAREIGRYAWTLEVEPYLPIFSLGPFSIRATDLGE